jgi:hypothetical protein
MTTIRIGQRELGCTQIYGLCTKRMYNRLVSRVCMTAIFVCTVSGGIAAFFS